MTDELITEEDRNERMVALSDIDVKVLFEGFRDYKQYLSQFVSDETPSIQFEMSRVEPWLRSLQGKIGTRQMWVLKGSELCLLKAMAEFRLKKLKAEREDFFLKRPDMPEEAAEGLNLKITQTENLVNKSFFQRVQVSKIIGKNHFSQKSSPNPKVIIKNRGGGTVIVGDNNNLGT